MPRCTLVLRFRYLLAPSHHCSQVVGLSKLRTKYESHEAKRQLSNSFDLFAADERVLPSLPKLLGAMVCSLPFCLSAATFSHLCSLDVFNHTLPCCAGKSFFKKKKQPVPVRLTGKDWAAQIRKACEATYLFWSGEESHHAVLLTHFPSMVRP